MKSPKSEVQGPKSKVRVIDDVWFCPVHPDGSKLRIYRPPSSMKLVVACLRRDEGPDWKAKGWRIAKLQVKEAR